MNKGIKIFWLISGVLLLVLGIVCMCNPAETLLASAWLIGLFTLISGISKFIFTLKTQMFLPNSGSRMLSSLLQIFVGIVFLANSLLVTISLPFIFAMWIIIEGISLAIESFDFKKVGFSFWWCMLLLGITGAILGFFGLRNPEAAGNTLSILIGLGVAFAGVSYIVAFFGLNKLQKKVEQFIK